VKVIGYARTSWAEQAQDGHPSVQDQESRLREFAQSTGISLRTIHTDTGLSPKHGTCAGLVSILDDMDNDWDAVLVVGVDRLCGLNTISVDPVEELRQNGKHVILADDRTAKVLAQRVRTQPPRERTSKRANGDGTQRRKIAERLLKGREAGARAGKHQSGPAPFGYRRDYAKRSTDGVLLVPDAEEADIVRLIFREYLRLRSMKRLIKLLDDQGLRTRRGKRWSRAGVSWILKNDTYVGRVHFGKIRVKGRHESIVPPIVFNKVQKLIRQNNKRKRPAKVQAAKPTTSGSDRHSRAAG
jgi:site-specific DNA recombinase